MPTLIRDEVDISHKPRLEDLTATFEKTQLTIGDMHANTVKFLYFLFRHGLFTGLNDAEYQELAHIMLKEPSDTLKAVDLSRFRVLLAKIKAQPKARLIIIGDELCDRVGNDYFMLKFFEKLSEEDVEVDVLLSNHGADFINVIEGKFKTNWFGNLSHRLTSCGPSIDRLYHLINRGLISQDEIISLTCEHYLPQVKAIVYTIDKATNRITLFTHAPVGLEVLEPLAKKLGLADFDDSTIERLATSIDKINLAFAKALKRGNSYESLIKSQNTWEDTNLARDPFEYLTWNREYNIINRPREHKGYLLAFVHGHDRDEPDTDLDHIFSLDSLLGHPFLAKPEQGEYLITVSHDDVPYPHRLHEPDLKVKKQRVFSMLRSNSSLGSDSDEERALGDEKFETLITEAENTLGPEDEAIVAAPVAGLFGTSLGFFTPLTRTEDSEPVSIVDRLEATARGWLG